MFGVARVAAPLADGGLGVQTHDAWQWLLLAAPVLGAVAVVAGVLLRARRRGGPTLAAVAMQLKAQGRPAWMVAGWLIALWSLLVAFVGFMWDVAWHADTGRDRELFTVPHTMIVVGLLGILVAGLAAAALATVEGSPAGWRAGRLHLPASALALILLGAGAVAGFPLDDFWHATYGVDVTLWSPTHLLMIGAASLTPLALWLMAAEGGGGARVRLPVHVLIAGFTLVGLSTFQLEYDLGIAQWQALFQPVLIAGAAAFTLVAVRVAAGRGAALAATAVFVISRGLLALFLVRGLGDSLPHFPLYLAEAAIVEVALLRARGLPGLARTVVAGLAIGTVGLAAEGAWTRAWFQYPWQPGLFPQALLAVLMAVAAAVLGLGAGRVLSDRPPPLRTPLVLAALIAVGAALAVHLPLRTVDPGAAAAVQTAPTGETLPATDAAGNPVTARLLRLSLTVSPPGLADGADRFDVVAWQGHAPVRHIALVQTGPGSYRALEGIPDGGSWKSILILGHGDVLEALPVSMPADADSGLPAIAPPAAATLPFVPAEQLLMREVHGAAQWPFDVVVALFGVAVVVWVAVLTAGFARVSRQWSGGEALLTGRPRARTARGAVAASR